MSEKKEETFVGIPDMAPPSEWEDEEDDFEFKIVKEDDFEGSSRYMTRVPKEIAEAILGKKPEKEYSRYKPTPRLEWEYDGEKITIKPAIIVL